MLAAELGVDEEQDVFAVDGIVGKRDLFEIARLDRPELHFPPHHPLDNPELLGEDPNIFHIIREHGRSSSSIPTNPSTPRSSAFSGRRALTPRSWRSR